MGKGPEETSSEDTHRANRFMKRCSASLSIRKRHIQTTGELRQI